MPLTGENIFGRSLPDEKLQLSLCFAGTNIENTYDILYV